MVWDFLKDDTQPRLPNRARVVLTMALVGILTGLISSLPSPLPSIRLEEDGLILNAASSPLHAGLAFAIGIAACMWAWVSREASKCLLTAVLVFLGWLAAVNTANDLYQFLIGSGAFGSETGAKATREASGLIIGGVVAGAVGAGLSAFGAGIPAAAIRRPQNWGLIVLAGAVAGIMLYPAAVLRMPHVMFVPWQALVAASIGFGLTRR
ncbi:hypothetical protein [Methyloceanibacter sp. wino2]|uniref:hypothetical protein n=1 Tax=Methyloceanibacter sp. wino2 TaxID=2170729 RepID=UPI000D3E4D69|nr:hypothetical protein [Methyloceanibacter sp. wino2]